MKTKLSAKFIIFSLTAISVGFNLATKEPGCDLVQNLYPDLQGGSVGKTELKTESCDEVNRETAVEKVDKTMADVSSSTSLALVPYNENKVLPHEKPERNFSIAGHDFRIEQNWHQLGVAAVVWDSAIVLAEYMGRHRELIAGKRVLELGSGTGLAGMVASALGADVTLTERDEAMEHLESTLKLNTGNKNWKIRSQVLDWTANPTPSEFSGYDVILGADIIYIEDTFHDLLRTLTSVAASNKNVKSVPSDQNVYSCEPKDSTNCMLKDERFAEGRDNCRHSVHFDYECRGEDKQFYAEQFNGISEKKAAFSGDSDCLVLLSCRIRYERDLKFLDLLRAHFAIQEIFYDKEREIKVFAARQSS